MGRKGGERSVENVNLGKLGVLRENDLLLCSYKCTRTDTKLSVFNINPRNLSKGMIIFLLLSPLFLS